MNFSEFLQPAIFGLTGKPGAGKSYFATRLIIAEITKGKNRPIVSNVPINKKKLRDYVGKDFYYYPLETYTDNKAFFSNRGYYHIEVDDLGANVDFKPLLKEDDEGVLFIIDEAHLYFNARNWKMMPQATISYITTIRHVGDSLIWMCQKFSDIDSQIRGKTQAFHLLRNLEKEKLGMFKRGTGFRCYQYLEEAHISAHGTQTARSAQDFTYPFEIKVAECYNTSLFNKAHDKKYRIKAIPLNYVVYFGISCFVALLYWVFDGGFSKTISFLTPDMAKVNKVENVEIIESNETYSSSNAFELLPAQDPLVDVVQYETPVKTFDSQELFQPLSDKDLKRYDDYWFGLRRKCKITFISDKVTSEDSLDFSFGAFWNKFAELNQIDLRTENGVWQVRTPYFTSFISYIKDSGQGANLKEIDVILKENVICELEHGYQIPVESSVATQGVIRTQRQYMDVGFKLNLVMESIRTNELLKINIENSDVMDLASDYPILQTFRSNNVLDVDDSMTYQIADFKSVSSQVSKGIFKKSKLEDLVTNKIFITYGNN